MSRRLPKSALFWLSACVIWCLLVFWLSISADPPQVRIPLLDWDKLQHGTAYALLALFAGKSLRYLRFSPGRSWILAGAFALAFGILMEYLQFAMGRGRMAEPGDILADAIGVGLVCLVAILGGRWLAAGEPDA
ncbi:MAG TPA: VanZ family protein [Gammaproteobacteria bacterium]|nr:VanZ family protein [Gammaproteobacteria bacterium]